MIEKRQGSVEEYQANPEFTIKYPNAIRRAHLKLVGYKAGKLKDGDIFHEGVKRVSASRGSLGQRIRVVEDPDPSKTVETTVSITESEYQPVCISADRTVTHRAGGHEWEVKQTFNSNPGSDNSLSLHAISVSLGFAVSLQHDFEYSEMVNNGA